jgi:hypothetical protein
LTDTPSTTPTAPPAPPERGSAWRLWLLPVAAALLILTLGMRQCAAAREAIGDRLNRTTVTQDLVVDRVQSVAKLVSTEATVRDVLIYRNTWYGSTKQSLVVITAKVLAGIDLHGASEVRIDSATKTIDITIPPAQVLAVEVTDMRTYDERGGLWNPFKPSDRDAIFRQARQQLVRAAGEMKLTARAEESAAQMLTTMFGVDGWNARVTFRAPAALDR